jgi:hypothetical protein
MPPNCSNHHTAGADQLQAPPPLFPGLVATPSRLQVLAKSGNRQWAHPRHRKGGALSTMTTSPAPPRSQRHASSMTDTSTHCRSHPSSRALPPRAASEASASASGSGCRLTKSVVQRTLSASHQTPPMFGFPTEAAQLPNNRAELGRIFTQPVAGTVRVSQSVGSLQTDEMLLGAARSITPGLQSHRISFEGRDPPVSLQPTFVADKGLFRVARVGSAIRIGLNRAISLFIEERHGNMLGEPVSTLSSLWTLGLVGLSHTSQILNASATTDVSSPLFIGDQHA